jgi:hypothetical protein
MTSFRKMSVTCAVQDSEQLAKRGARNGGTTAKGNLDAELMPEIAPLVP